VSRRNRLSVQEYIQGVLNGDKVVLSRAITLVESNLESDQLLAQEVMEEILPFSGKSLRIGITGVPGVGKSTFIESFGHVVVEKGYRLAVLAIDPSSQKTGGSILGDKTRMEILSTDSRAFIRPSPSGITLGGVSARTREAMLLCEAAGFEVVFIETVGVGQSETIVKGMVDFFLLLMLAGAGDELQGIKKGIMEICDALIIHKADGDNVPHAQRAKREYANALHLFPSREDGWIPEVQLCSSTEKFGLEEIWTMIKKFEHHQKSKGYFFSNRELQRKNWLTEHVRFLLEQTFYKNQTIQSQLEEIEAGIMSGLYSPIAKARELVQFFLNENR
jgi:LAO/AO transport system kinase